MTMNRYYVYTYIDPRNLEGFYYGKGKGSRKSAHVFDVSDSDKARRIRDIKKVGLEPIIRVIAAGQGRRWGEAMLGFQKGDVVAAYLKRYGYVGIGKVVEPAGLYTTTHMRASLNKQPGTIDFLEREFGLDIRALVV